MTLSNNFRLYMLVVSLAVVAGSCERDAYHPPVNNFPIPRIIELIPNNAKSGELLTIRGLNFSNDPTKNIIQFNGIDVAATLTTDSLIQVIVPETDKKRIGVTVRSNDKISNRRILAIVEVTTFQDGFDRPDVTPIDGSVSPNPIGSDWHIAMGQFGLENGMIASHAAGVQSLMFYRPDGLNMITNAAGAAFILSLDISVSDGGTFAGVVFNVSDDGQKMYLLRLFNGGIQFLKTPDRFNSWSGFLYLGGPTTPFPFDKKLHLEISSFSPGNFHIKLTNPETLETNLDENFVDNDPLTGGVAGLYYFGLANPTNVYFDNFSVELQN